MLILLAYPNYDHNDLSFMGGEKNVGDVERGFSSDDNAGCAVEHGGQRLISPLLDQLQVAIQSPTIFRPNNQRTIPSSDDDRHICLMMILMTEMLNNIGTGYSGGLSYFLLEEEVNKSCFTALEEYLP